MKITRFVIVFIIIGIIVFLIPDVHVSKQMLLLDSLKQISSIVLAITGAWAAIIYPDSLKNIMTKKQTYVRDMKAIHNLIRPMISSLIILGTIVGLEISAFILRLVPINQEYLPYFRYCSLSIIVFLYVLQIWTLIITMIPINDTLKKAKHENTKNEHLDRATSSSIIKKTI